jgi:hypothetical protein
LTTLLFLSYCSPIADEAAPLSLLAAVLLRLCFFLHTLYFPRPLLRDVVATRSCCTFSACLVFLLLGSLLLGATLRAPYALSFSLQVVVGMALSLSLPMERVVDAGSGWRCCIVLAETPWRCSGIGPTLAALLLGLGVKIAGSAGVFFAAVVVVVDVVTFNERVELPGRWRTTTATGRIPT